MVTTFHSRPTAEEKAEDLRQRALETSRLEEKLIFLRSAVQYAPTDCSLLLSLAEHLYDRSQELMAKGDVNQALPYLSEAEEHLRQRQLFLARNPQSVQHHGVFCETYLKVLVAKLDGRAHLLKERMNRESRTCSFKAFLKRMKKHLPELDVHSATEPSELSMLRERIYDWLLSLCKSLATTADGAVDPRVSDGLYSLLHHSGYLHRLYEGSEEERPSADKGGTLEGFKVRIFGAGISGLTLAYCLRLRGAEIVGLLDRRGDSSAPDQSFQDLVARGQNVSWSDMERFLRPVMGDDAYEYLLRKLYASGAVMDRREGKVRCSIGAFQEVILEELKSLGVSVGLGYPGGTADLQTDRGLDMQCVATGVRAVKDFSSELKPIFFEDYSSYVATHLSMYAAEEEYRFFSNDRDEGCDGMGWRSVNETVHPVELMAKEIHRFVGNLRRMSTPENCVKKVQALQNARMVAHSFSFGNDRSGFDRGLDHKPYPSIMGQLKIKPWILTHTISRVNPDVPTVFLGDATCSSHPLAAIGHSLVFQNVSSFVRMAECKQALKHLHKASSNAHIHTLISKLDRDFEELYERNSRQTALMVFLQSCLCSLYSES